VGYRRIKDQRSDPRDQAEEEGDTNPLTSQRDVGYEEIAGIANHYTNPETRASGSNGITVGEGRRIPGTGRGH
jgi:hypothetical protein